MLSYPVLFKGRGGWRLIVCVVCGLQNCSEGNSILQVDVKNHIGPYFQNISMSGKNCPLGAN